MIKGLIDKEMFSSRTCLFIPNPLAISNKTKLYTGFTVMHCHINRLSNGQCSSLLESKKQKQCNSLFLSLGRGFLYLDVGEKDQTGVKAPLF